MTTASAESQPAIRCIDLGYRIDGFVVLDAIELEVQRGELHTLLGPSGSGKSSLLRLIAGLACPTRGTIELMGVDATRTPPHLRNIAYVNQSATTYDHLSVADNLQLAYSLAPPTSRTARHATEHPLVNAFELENLLPQRAGVLSGGQRQRLAILRALLTARPILLLDEPLAHLQESLKRPLHALLQRWIRENSMTCILVTHDSQEAFEFSDRISILDQGNVLQSGTPLELFAHPSNRTVAERFDRPSIQWFNLPPILGMRPRQWIPGRCPSTLGSQASIVSEGLHWDPTSKVVQAHGILTSKRDIESSVFLEFVAGTQRVTAVRPLDESNAFVLGQQVVFHYCNPVELHS